jgi:hypothetical protein
MILHCSFEELSALDAATERVLEAAGSGESAASREILDDLEALAPRLDGDFSLDSLADQESVERAIRFLLEDTRARTDEFILQEHAAAESAIRAYFEYANVLTVFDRIRLLGAEMRALIELMTGSPPTDEAARSVSFED